MDASGSNRQQKIPTMLLGLFSIALCVSLAGCGWNPFNTTKNNSPSSSTTETTTDEDNDTTQKEVSVFFSRGTTGEPVDVLRPLPEELQKQPIRFAVGELLKGPSETEKKKGFFTEIPAGTELLGVSRHEAVITVDMSHKFASGGGSNSMTQRVEELKRTVYALDKKHQLRVSIEGKPLDVMGGEGLEVNDTLKRQLQ
jgi:spore germination protein GerM